jgi:hypothetical protein
MRGRRIRMSGCKGDRARAHTHTHTHTHAQKLTQCLATSEKMHLRHNLPGTSLAREDMKTHTDTNFSEKHTASNLRSEVTTLGCIGCSKTALTPPPPQLKWHFDMYVFSPIQVTQSCTKWPTAPLTPWKKESSQARRFMRGHTWGKKWGTFKVILPISYEFSMW